MKICKLQQISLYLYIEKRDGGSLMYNFNKKEMKAKIKLYLDEKSAEITVDDNRKITVSFDVQDINFFETKEEVREIVDGWLQEIKDVENYEEIANALEDQLGKYVSE